MRKIVYTHSVSLDGFFEGPGRDIGWHYVDEELHAHFNDYLGAMGGFLSGRVTHQLMADHWPTADQKPDASPTEREFAAIWRDMPKTVYSRTLEHADWNTTIEREVDPAKIRAMKEQPGGDLVVNGAVLAAEFAAHDLIDEYRVYVAPILLGRGERNFPDTDTRTRLTLTENRTFGNGVVLLRYDVERP
ncbi:putative protein YyaP [Streptomyces sp. RB5]|uniref:Bacterial bifunctional deaminase-reductase C-terminal domain-containing protein n=1 Tax=Streptomyces smaragdinus TaxID=2585196 RepID=A0A7K0CMP0_9ACTN|nr:dihydrofolate reductase family protein [Streptomyces smaragdinus]MQY14750.1 putative protein YyaP [Streptomyces smaragdinus]